MTFIGLGAGFGAIAGTVFLPCLAWFIIARFKK